MPKKRTEEGFFSAESTATILPYAEQQEARCKCNTNVKTFKFDNV